MKKKRSQKIHLFDFKDKPIWLTVTVWPTLRDLRQGNKMSARAKCYAYIQPWYLGDGGLHGKIHFAERYVHHELSEHECTHFKKLLFEVLELDLHDPDDEEICAELSGQLNAAVNSFVFA